MNRNNIQPLSEQSALSERVYHAILKLFTQGAIASDATIRIDILANALGVSPTPVREALARLESTGLVERQERRGYRVPPPLSASQVDDLMEAREFIEVACLESAMRSPGRSFATAIETAIAEQQAAVETHQLAGAMGQTVGSNTFWRVVEADLHFHAVIFGHSSNPFLSLMANALSAQQHRVRQSAEKGLSDALDALREHRAIADAVSQGDIQAAVVAMKAHLDSVRGRAQAATS